jgi:hypothetical protein
MSPALLPRHGDGQQPFGALPWTPAIRDQAQSTSGGPGTPSAGEGTFAAPVDASAVRKCLMSKQRGHPISRQDLQGRTVTDARPEEVVREGEQRDVHRSRNCNYSALPELERKQRESARRLRSISPLGPAELSRPSESPSRLQNFRNLRVPGLPRTDCWVALQVSSAPNLPDTPIPW